MKKETKKRKAKAKTTVKKSAGAVCKDGWEWYSPWSKPFHVLGFGWDEPAKQYRRLPELEKIEAFQNVDGLAWNCAGGQVRFRTDAKQILVKVKLRQPAEMDHMATTGEAGIDAYVGELGQMNFAGVTRFGRNAESYQVTVCNFPDSERRIVTLYLPLYRGIESLEVGLPQGSKLFAAPRPLRSKRVVIYGTSITQGGCASRPGMAYPNILSREIDAEFINLGFSGSGRGEPVVAEVISTLRPPALFVMDYEANCSDPERMQATLEPFLAILRKRWPTTKMLVVSKVRYASEVHNPAPLKQRLTNRDFQRATVNKLKRAGDKNIFFYDGGKLLGADFNECAVDGVHQTDLGFYRMASGLKRTVAKLLTEV